VILADLEGGTGFESLEHGDQPLPSARLLAQLRREFFLRGRCKRHVMRFEALLLGLGFNAFAETLRRLLGVIREVLDGYAGLVEEK
jgi:hypothetical protein